MPPSSSFEQYPKLKNKANTFRVIPVAVAGLIVHPVVPHSTNMDLPQVAVLEDIYAPDLKSDLPHPHVTAGEKETHVYYLAYGSNMAASTFLKRRGIKPLHSLAVYVPTLELVFDLAALPYFEPRMANVREISTLSTQHSAPYRHPWDDPTPPTTPRGLIGVAYYITVEDLARVYATEGGGSSYHLADVDCWSIPEASGVVALAEKPKKVTAKVLIVKRNSRIRAAPGQASLRYLNILRKGARENNLPASYIAYLGNLEHYRRTSIRQLVGGILLALLVAPFMLVLLSVARLLKDKEGRSPGWVQAVTVYVGYTMWKVYDIVWRPIFGNGELTQ